jgi:hypothetical protein
MATHQGRGREKEGQMASSKTQTIKLDDVEFTQYEGSEDKRVQEAVVEGYRLVVGPKDEKEQNAKKVRWIWTVFTPAGEVYQDGEQATEHGAKNRSNELMNRARREDGKAARKAKREAELKAKADAAQKDAKQDDKKTPAKKPAQKKAVA